MANELKLKDYCSYIPEIHINHGKEYRSSELELIMSGEYSLADLSLMLGRTAKAISSFKSQYKRQLRKEERENNGN
ncbi:MAG: hypothetical protein ACRCZH_02605 [Cetobacterium sp.]